MTLFFKDGKPKKVLARGRRFQKGFVIAMFLIGGGAGEPQTLDRRRREITSRYDMHRGWFGTGTLLHSVTCHPGHPLEVIGRGLSQGNAGSRSAAIWITS
jgi:hypothetical protein